MSHPLDDTSQKSIMPADGWLRNLREARGLTRREIAEKLGVSIPAIQDYERNEVAGKITLATLRKYAEVLGCEVDVKLIPRSDSVFPPPPAAAKSKAQKTQARPGTSRVKSPPPPRDDTFTDRMGLWSAAVRE